MFGFAARAVVDLKQFCEAIESSLVKELKLSKTKTNTKKSCCDSNKHIFVVIAFVSDFVIVP